MFGYVMADIDALTEEGRKRYASLYCGLCRSLGERHGQPGRMTLTYDMTFLATLLSAVYLPEETEGANRCQQSPFKARRWVRSPYTDYAADMNVVLAYYKCLDDWHDDRSPSALLKIRALEKRALLAAEKYPRQRDAIQASLAAIGEMERRDELNPDLPANAFGALMAQLFAPREGDEHAKALMGTGAALGRFVYLVDAVCDLSHDIKKGNYNPLVSQPVTDFEPMLAMLMADCTRQFDRLPIGRDIDLLRNVLYSGVWARYNAKRKGGDAT